MRIYRKGRFTIMHTNPGLLQGFVIDYYVIRYVFAGKLHKFKIPLKIMGYDKKKAERIHLEELEFRYIVQQALEEEDY